MSDLRELAERVSISRMRLLHVQLGGSPETFEAIMAEVRARHASKALNEAIDARANETQSSKEGKS